MGQTRCSSVSTAVSSTASLAGPSALLLDSRILSPDVVPVLAAPSRDRERELMNDSLHGAFAKGDRLARYVLAAQWALAIAAAALVSPGAWRGRIDDPRVHLQSALLAGVALNAAPLLLIARRPGWWVTRHAVAAALALWSALAIHLCAGRLESHFHVFASLALLGLYPSFRPVLTASAVIVADHLVRGALWPGSLYGVEQADPWRFAQHTAWLALADAAIAIGCWRARAALATSARHEATLEAAHHELERRSAERTAQLTAGHARLRAMVATVNAVPWEMAPDTLDLDYVGPQVARVFGHRREAWLEPGFFEGRIADEDRLRVVRAIAGTRATGDGCDIECRLAADGGEPRDVRIVAAAAPADPAGGVRLWGLMLDVTEQRRTESDLEAARQLEAFGRLALGVTHEINTPVQFVGDSLKFIEAGAGDLLRLLRRQRRAGEALCAGALAPDGYRAELAAAEDEADLEYLEQNLPAAARSASDGLRRVTEIVTSMRALAHPDQRSLGAVDVNAVIGQTLTIARGEYKHVADVEAQLGDLPPVIGAAGELAQVFLNIVVNAAHAIDEVVAGGGGRGRITVATRADGDEVVVAIADTGAGIPDAARARVFDRSFTTKAPGRGTGQGLAIARAAVERHGGRLTFQSEVGRGTTFEVRLPILGPEPPSDEGIDDIDDGDDGDGDQPVRATG